VSSFFGSGYGGPIMGKDRYFQWWMGEPSFPREGETRKFAYKLTLMLFKIISIHSPKVFRIGK
jgi:hypothetical protein